MFPVMLTLGAGNREAAILRLVDWDTLDTLAETEYRSELSCFYEEQRNEDSEPMPPRCKFNGSSFVGDHFYTCTYNEIVVYTFDNGFQKVRTISRPTFADLHHVHCDGERLWVVITGLDLVEELDLDGNLIRQYQVADDVEQRYDLSRDYRRVAHTKPHTSHPSWITILGDQKLVSLQRTQRVIDLETCEEVISGFPGRIHDGHLHGDSLYYSSTNGYVIRVPVDAMEIQDKVFTYRLFGRRNPGWCRGLCVMDDDDHWLVGYTRSRKTRSPGFKPSLAQRASTFVKDGVRYLMGSPNAYTFFPRMHSHIAQIDVRANRIIKDYPLGGPSMTVYGIYRLNPEWSELVNRKLAGTS